MILRALALAAPAALLAACTNSVEVEPAALPSAASASAWVVYQGAMSASPAVSWAPDTVAAGTFLPYRPDSPAITYEPTVVPPGARAEVGIARNAAGMIVRLTTRGLIPRRSYGAHLHTAPCTAAPADAGPHFQHQKDPKTPSVNPSYANPRNEIWLDFTADATGAATVTSEQRWSFTAGSSPRSLVIHTLTTRTRAGAAGTAGERAACLTLPAR
ncbi:superoxide dismutase family protein [Actinoplanes sp. NPDC048796]|uniref:superoxide dismutase family protein n=1 Tax=Actinoplanes sp. NPDC048796 TaxID=3155640 RepID=UPI0033D0EE72